MGKIKLIHHVIAVKHIISVTRTASGYCNQLTRKLPSRFYLCRFQPRMITISYKSMTVNEAWFRYKMENNLFRDLHNF